MEYTLKELKAKREFDNMQLQHEYDNLETYEQKLSFIYDLMEKTQSKLEQEYQGDFFKQNSKQSLLEELEKSNIKDEVSFVKFINDRIITKLISPHVRIKGNPISKEEVKEIGEEAKLSEERLHKDDNVTYSFEDGTCKLKIKSFMSKYLDDAKKTFENLKNDLKQQNCDNVILDIRGNGGGTDEFFDLLSCFADKDILENITYTDTLSGETISTSHVAIPAGSEREYNKYLLVDGEVFSASDALTRICKQTGFAKVIGEKTRGEGLGLTPFKLNLISLNETQQKEYGMTDGYLQFPIEAPTEGQTYRTEPDISCNAEQAEAVATEQINEQNCCQ